MPLPMFFLLCRDNGCPGNRTSSSIATACPLPQLFSARERTGVWEWESVLGPQTCSSCDPSKRILISGLYFFSSCLNKINKVGLVNQKTVLCPLSSAWQHNIWKFGMLEKLGPSPPLSQACNVRSYEKSFPYIIAPNVCLPWG